MTIFRSGCVDRTKSDMSITRHSRSLSLSRFLTILIKSSCDSAFTTFSTSLCACLRDRVVNATNPAGDVRYLFWKRPLRWASGLVVEEKSFHKPRLSKMDRRRASSYFEPVAPWVVGSEFMGSKDVVDVGGIWTVVECIDRVRRRCCRGRSRQLAQM